MTITTIETNHPLNYTPHITSKSQNKPNIQVKEKIIEQKATIITFLPRELITLSISLVQEFFPIFQDDKQCNLLSLSLVTTANGDQEVFFRAIQIHSHAQTF